MKKIQFVLTVFAILLSSKLGFAQENEEQLKTYLETNLPKIIAIESYQNYHLLNDSIDVAWNWGHTGNVLASIGNSIHGAGKEGSSKNRFAQFYIEDSAGNQRRLCSMIYITSLENEVGSLPNHALFTQTFINPDTQTKYSIMIKSYFKRYATAF